MTEPHGALILSFFNFLAETPFVLPQNFVFARLPGRKASEAMWLFIACSCDVTSLARWYPGGWVMQSLIMQLYRQSPDNKRGCDTSGYTCNVHRSVILLVILAMCTAHVAVFRAIHWRIQSFR